MNLTPLHPNRSVNSQSKSKRKMYKRTNVSKCQATVSVQICFERLKKSLDIVTEQAANLFYNGEYKKCVNAVDEYELIHYKTLYLFSLLTFKIENINFPQNFEE